MNKKIIIIKNNSFQFCYLMITQKKDSFNDEGIFMYFMHRWFGNVL